jgi:HSP20 family protein
MLSLFNDWNGLRQSEFAELFRTLSTFDALRSDVDRAFGWRDPRFFAGREIASPVIGVSDSGAAFTLRAELPGLSEKDIEITLNEGTLTLRGERKVEVPEGYSAHRVERSSYRVERSYRLPAKVDADKAQAVMKHGVLTLTLPKAPEAQPKQITVKSG